MIIEKLVAGPLFTNTYLAVDERTKQALVVDAGKDVAEKVVGAAEETGAKIVFVINTHGHWDHVAGNAALQRLTGAKILVHAADEKMLLQPHPRMKLPFFIEPSKADGYLSDGKKIELGTTTLECMHTPGHTPGSTCFYARAQQTVFTGDTLFERGHGRTDFEGGSEAQIRGSLRKLAQLPAETRVLAGHGKETTVGKEREWIDAMLKHKSRIG